MYKIKPYSEYIQSELIQFLSAEPNQWQAKVIASLGFKVIYSFEEITKKLSLSPVYILKTLLIAEKYHIVTYTNEGWIINSRLDINDLNDFLALDIPDYDIGSSKRMSNLVKYGHLNKNSKTGSGSTLPSIEPEKQGAISGIKDNHFAHRKFDADSFNIISDAKERPVDGSGRKRTKEWNTNNALEFQRSIRGIIDKKNSGVQSNKATTNTIPHVRKQASDDEVKAERLYVELCTKFPEYDAYLTRLHKKDPSLRMMQLLQKKITNDLSDEEIELGYTA